MIISQITKGSVMTKKPIIFNVNAFLFLAIAISVPFQILLGLEQEVANLSIIMNRLNVLNVAIIVTFFSTALMFYSVSRHIIWFLPLCLSIVIANNMFMMKYSPYNDEMITLIATSGFALFTLFTLKSNSLKIVKDPSRQWWRVSTRKRKFLPVNLKLGEKAFDFGRSFDISETGAYVMQDISEFVFKEGDELRLKIGDIHLDAEVVRISEMNKSYPEGVGFKFKDMSLTNKIKLYRTIML